ncbi:MAG: matrixin family metalloprotease, partial [Actinomycetota bacterium]
LRQAGKMPPLIIGVTDLDLFVPELNFIFGQADTSSGVAIVSTARLSAEHYSGDPDLELLKERTAKEATHEIGHIFGLSHCTKPECIMFFSANVTETDQKGPGFCTACSLWLRSEIEAVPRG